MREIDGIKGVEEMKYLGIDKIDERREKYKNICKREDRKREKI